MRVFHSLARTDQRSEKYAKGKKRALKIRALSCSKQFELYFSDFLFTQGYSTGRIANVSKVELISPNTTTTARGL